MIRNDRQLAIAKRKLNEAEEAYEQAGAADKALWRDLIADVRCEIDEYQAIREGRLKIFELTSLDDLPEAVIKARLALKWTQRELGDELQVSEQNVQRDEARSYENASWTRLADVLDALGYTFTGRLQPANEPRRVYDATAAALVPTVFTTAFQHVAREPIQQFPANAGVTS